MTRERETHISKNNQIPNIKHSKSYFLSYVYHRYFRYFMQ